MTSFQTADAYPADSNHTDVVTLDRDGLQQQWISARRKRRR